MLTKKKFKKGVGVILFIHYEECEGLAIVKNLPSGQSLMV